MDTLILNFPNGCLNSFYFTAEQVLYRNIKDGKLYAVKVVLSATLFCDVSIQFLFVILFLHISRFSRLQIVVKYHN